MGSGRAEIGRVTEIWRMEAKVMRDALEVVWENSWRGGRETQVGSV